MARRAFWGGGLLLAALAACSGNGTGPDDAPAPDGIDFGLEEGTAGAHYADRQHPSPGDPLAGEFAVAMYDSVGGIVMLGYDGGTRNLFILQVQLTFSGAGTYTCGPVENGPACHARLFENVREEDGIVRVDGRLDLTSGTVTVGGVGPEDVWGSFEARFERTAGEGVETIDVVHGTFLVDLVDAPDQGGGLDCLVEIAVGATDCG